jgi:hypothetical protein
MTLKTESAPSRTSARIDSRIANCFRPLSESQFKSLPIWDVRVSVANWEKADVPRRGRTDAIDRNRSSPTVKNEPVRGKDEALHR